MKHLLHSPSPHLPHRDAEQDKSPARPHDGLAPFGNTDRRFFQPARWDRRPIPRNRLRLIRWLSMLRPSIVLRILSKP